MQSEQGDKETAHRHHRIVPIALITLGIPTALVVGFLLVANLLFHDEPKPNDAALLLPDRDVPKEQNAYVDVEAMNADVLVVNPQAGDSSSDKQVDAMLEGGAIDTAYAATVIQKYAKAENDFRLAAGKEFYQDPLTAHPRQLDVTKLSTVAYHARFIAKLVALDGLQKSINGDVSGGTGELLDIVRVGQLMESNQQTLIEWLIGGAVKQIGLSALRQVALRAQLTDAQAKSLTQELSVYRGSTDGLVTALKLEYAYSRSWVSKVHNLGEMYDSYFVAIDTAGNDIHRSMTGRTLSALDVVGIFRFYFWPNQSWRFLVEQRVQDVAAAQADCATGDFSAHRPTKYSHRTGIARIFESNTIGKLLADIGNVSLGGATVKACNETVAVSATQATLALSAYQHDNGKLPATLDELVPKYIASVPLDPFSGKPLSYDAVKKIVYSVGQDRKDEQGNTKTMNDYATPGNEWQNMYDPVFVVVK